MNDGTNLRPSHQPDEQVDDWDPCIESRVPSVGDAKVIYRLGMNGEASQLIIPIDRPMRASTFNRLVAYNDRLGLIERALDLAN